MSTVAPLALLYNKESLPPHKKRKKEKGKRNFPFSWDRRMDRPTEGLKDRRTARWTDGWADRQALNPYNSI